MTSLVSQSWNSVHYVEGGHGKDGKVGFNLIPSPFNVCKAPLLIKLSSHSSVWQ